MEVLIAHLSQELPGLNEWATRAWVAVNRRYVATDTALQNGDEVALFPPVSGG